MLDRLSVPVDGREGKTTAGHQRKTAENAGWSPTTVTSTLSNTG